MHWLRNKRMWLTVAHVGLIAGGVATSVMIPGAGLAIMAGTGLVNAAMPSPFSKPCPAPIPAGAIAVSKETSNVPHL